MNLVADEGVDRQIVELLRERGHAVLYVAELAPGLKDDAVLSAAFESGALLLTHDLDFGDLVFRQHRAASGVLLIRVDGLGPSVVTPGALRVRGLDGPLFRGGSRSRNV